jgi:hypothetical protein
MVFLQNLGLILLVVLSLGIIPVESLAIDFVWSLDGDGYWDVPGNWTPNGVPGSDASREDTVTIDAVPSRNVTVTYNGYSLGWANTAGMTVNAGDTLLILSPTSVTNAANASTVVNNGTIQLSTAGGNNASFGCGSSTVDLTGSGNLVLGTPSGGKNCSLSNGGAGGTFINHAPHIIRGAGEIDFWLTNQSQIIAENGTFRISATIYNTGGTLWVNGAGNAFFLTATIDGGQILPGAGQVILDSSQLSNLTLGPGDVRLNRDSVLLDGVTLPAGTQVTVPAGLTLDFGHYGASHTNVHNGSITNQGTLRVYGNVTGSGTISVADNASLQLWYPLSSGTTYQALQAGTLSMAPLANLYLANYTGIVLSGNFSFGMADPAKWTWQTNTGLIMNGGGPWQSLEVAGQDVGAVVAGFSSNFAIPDLELWTSGTKVYLTDAIDNGHRVGKPEALYVNSFWVDPGTTLNLNRLHLYTYLNGDVHQVKAGEGNLFGGGQIIDVSQSPGPRSVPGIMMPLLLD